MKKSQAVFLDRDGVLNKAIVISGKPYAPRKHEDFKIYNDVPVLIEKLKKRGYSIVIITNQPDIGNGITNKKELFKMHEELNQTMMIDKIYTCMHKQDANCSCRKPKSGMLMKAKNDLNIDMESSWMIGDRWSDVLAAKNAGVKSIFIDRGYKETQLKLIKCQIVKNLKEGIDIIIGKQ